LPHYTYTNRMAGPVIDTAHGSLLSKQPGRPSRSMQARSFLSVTQRTFLRQTPSFLTRPAVSRPKSLRCAAPFRKGAKNMKMEKHFVTFFSPGTFVPEQNCQEVKSWDVDGAVKLAGEIVQRYGARPYAFRFHTIGRGDKDFEPKTTKTGNLYFLGGKVRTLAEVEKDNDPKEEVLRSNMRVNKIKRVITNDNSYRFTVEFGDKDVLLDVTLPPLKKSA